MKDLIKLRSRDGVENYLKKVIKEDGSESFACVLKTIYHYYREGKTSNGRKFVDPPGGPMITEGDYLEEANAVVESIDFKEGYGWIITFKKNSDDISSHKE